jgi:hypothetical protein
MLVALSLAAAVSAGVGNAVSIEPGIGEKALSIIISVI